MADTRPTPTPAPRCPSCFLVLSSRDADGKCPRCAFALPSGWHGSSTCIVMAGARYTGKSIFLAVMIKQLEQLAASVGMDMSAATRSTRQVFAQYYEKPLYTQRGIMPPTVSLNTDDPYQREPLVFTLTARSGQRHHLAIRDVAGEDLERIDDLSPGALAFFRDADYVFFLFDPLRITHIRNKLRDFIPEQLGGGDPKVVLDTTLDLIGDGGPRMGVILSKFDSMQALRTVDGGGEWSAIMQNAGSTLFRDLGPTVWSTGLDGELVHEEVRSLLLKLEAGPFVATVERRAGGGRPDGHRFFAVSALGEPPAGQDLSARGIAPFRCLDPLRWALPAAPF
jgi:hypothetical protein